MKNVIISKSYNNKRSDASKELRIARCNATINIKIPFVIIFFVLLFGVNIEISSAYTFVYGSAFISTTSCAPSNFVQSEIYSVGSCQPVGSLPIFGGSPYILPECSADGTTVTISTYKDFPCATLVNTTTQKTGCTPLQFNLGSIQLRCSDAIPTYSAALFQIFNDSNCVTALSPLVMGGIGRCGILFDAPNTITCPNTTDAIIGFYTDFQCQTVNEFITIPIGRCTRVNDIYTLISSCTVESSRGIETYWWFWVIVYTKKLLLNIYR